jgi:hypothetical protein
VPFQQAAKLVQGHVSINAKPSTIVRSERIVQGRASFMGETAGGLGDSARTV